MRRRRRITIDRLDEFARLLNLNLVERSAFKHIGLTQAMGEALEKRGVPELTASLAAELGMRAFDRAFSQWADPASQQTLTELTREALSEFRAAAAAPGSA